MWGRVALVGALCLACRAPAASVAGPVPASAQRVEVVAPPPVFTDPERKAKLMMAVPAIEAYLASTVERDELVGLAAGLVIDDELVWFGGYGYRDLARELPVERDTAFGIGSITKSITATAVMMLQEREQLELDRPAERWLPALTELVYPSADSPRITVRHLLTHTAGLPRMGNFPEYPPAPQSMEAFLASVKGMPLDRAPGVARVYSNLGFQLLGPLIATVTGEDHRAFITRELLRPIGMTGAAWTAETVDPSKLALPYDEFDGAPHLRAHWQPGAADAAGGLYASVEDLAAFAIFNLRAWPPGGDPSQSAAPLSAAGRRETHAFGRLRSFSARNGEGEAHAIGRVETNGIGWSVYATCELPQVVAHIGKTLGHRASLYMLPRQGVALILLSNTSSVHSSVIARDSEYILGLLVNTGGLSLRTPQAAPALLERAASLSSLLASWDTEAYAESFSPDHADAVGEQRTAKRFADWAKLVGACEGASLVEAEEAYAGKVELSCERGQLQVDLRVAPWDGHPITSLDFVGVRGEAARPAVASAAAKLTQALNRWEDDAATALFAETAPLARYRDFLSKVHEVVGACELGELQFLEPEGASFSLRCAGGSPNLRISLDAEDRVSRLEIREGAKGPCY